MSEVYKPAPMPHGDSGYEKRDVNIKVTLIVTAITVVFILLSLIFLTDWFMLTKEEMLYEMALKPESPALIEMRKNEQEVLSTYKVIDPQKGIYRIPIERAMQLLVAESSQKQSKDSGTK